MGTKRRIRHEGETKAVADVNGQDTEPTLLGLAREVHGRARALGELWQQAGVRTRGHVPACPEPAEPGLGDHGSLLDCLRATDAVLAEQEEAARALLGRLGE